MVMDGADEELREVYGGDVNLWIMGKRIGGEGKPAKALIALRGPDPRRQPGLSKEA